MSQRTRHPLAIVAAPAGRDQPPSRKENRNLLTRVSPQSHVSNPAKGLASYLRTLSEAATADVVAAAVREQLTGPDSGWLTARPSGDGVVIRSAAARVTVRPGLVAVEGWGRVGFSSGQTDGLLAACPPQARGSRFPLPHSVLDGLPAGSTFTTVALAVHIAGVLAVCGDGVAIPDRWLAGRVGVDPGTLRRHRPLLRSVFRIERDNTASVWRYHSGGWSFDEGVAWIPSGVLTRQDLRPVDVAVLVGWLSWADYQGRMKGTWAVVADRARVHRSTVVRTVGRLRRLGLVVARRLRTELLRDPHWREDLRSARSAAERRSDSRCRPSGGARAGVPPYSTSQLCSKDLADSLPLHGADCAMQKNQQTEEGGSASSDVLAESAPLPETYRWKTPRAPKRVRVPDWSTFEALVGQPEWAGPTLDQVRGVARRAGWRQATAAALEVDWRIATLCPPRYPSGPRQSVSPLLRRPLPQPGHPRRGLRTRRPNHPRRPPPRRRQMADPSPLDRSPPRPASRVPDQQSPTLGDPPHRSGGHRAEATTDARYAARPTPPTDGAPLPYPSARSGTPARAATVRSTTTTEHRPVAATTRRRTHRTPGISSHA